jgi:hypothetical protein
VPQIIRQQGTRPGRHHLGTPGDIISECLGDFVGIRRFKKSALKPHLKTQWVIPPEANGAFVAAMGDVLSAYTPPRDPDRPLVCLDETTKQLTKETRAPKKGQATARHLCGRVGWQAARERALK